MRPPSPALRQALAAILVLALALSGVGRALASGMPGSASGLAMPICHVGSGGAVRPADPAAPPRHDCCDQCALCAPVLPPVPPAFAGPVPAEHVAVHARTIRWAPAVGRVRTPRLSQGPPAA